MKKIVTALLILSLLLCACAPISSGGGAATTDPSTTADPHAWIPPEWKVPGEMTEAKRQEIKKALSAKDGIDHTGHIDYEENCVCGMVWLGTWSGYEILAEKGNGSHGFKADTDIVFLGGIFYAYKDGEIHSLEGIYNLGKISKEEMAQLSELNLENALSKPEIPWPEGVDESIRKGCNYLGFHEGYVILREPTYGEITFPKSEMIGGKEFFSSGGHPMLAYRDGTYQELKEVYEAGEISTAAVAYIWEIYRSFSTLFIR